MGTVRKTITLTDQQDAWIKAQIKAGHYTNDSECIRDLIRRDQERSAQREFGSAGPTVGARAGLVAAPGRTSASDDPPP